MIETDRRDETEMAIQIIPVYIYWRKYLPLVLQVPGRPPVAGDGEVAGLGVEGEQLEVHGAGEGEGDLIQDSNDD